MTPFGRLPEYTTYDLGAWALREALADCGLSHKDLDGLIVCRIPDYQRMGEMLGIDPRYAAITPGQGRMSGASIQMAAHGDRLRHGDDGRGGLRQRRALRPARPTAATRTATAAAGRGSGSRTA